MGQRAACLVGLAASVDQHGEEENSNREDHQSGWRIVTSIA
jgi:hypothetical protein